MTHIGQTRFSNEPLVVHKDFDCRGAKTGDHCQGDEVVYLQRNSREHACIELESLPVLSAGEEVDSGMCILLQVKPDCSNFDESQAWPLLLDNYVEWVKTRSNGS
jgi:hypothetical protein